MSESQNKGNTEGDALFKKVSKSMRRNASRTIYAGEYLRAVAMPMGGIGTGHVSLCGDGSLRQWQIFNQINHQAFLPHSFFAIWAKSGRASAVARVLQTPALYDDKDFKPAPLISDHIVPEEAKRLLKCLPGVQDIEFVGEYPVAYLTYLDTDLPVKVTLEAFSPFIPLNPKDSGLPAVIFMFTVSNESKQTADVSVAGSLQNAVGWDGVSSTVGVKNPNYGGNRNTVVRLRDLTAIDMSTTRLALDDAGYGQMTLAAFSKEATILPQWDDLDIFWQDFFQDGALANCQDGEPSSNGRTWNGALSASLTLKPGEKKQLVFVLAWYFPNRYTNRGKEDTGIQDAKSKFWLGNMYNNWFNSSLGVVEYVRDHFDRLVFETRLFHDTFYNSTLPYWLLNCISSQLSTIRCSTCFWTEDGKFYGFEGGCGASTSSYGPDADHGGSCFGVNCNQLWNYAQALAKVFPSLERTMREIEMKVQCGEDGSIPQRTVLPLYLPRRYSSDKTSIVYAVDGHCGAILKVYREYRQFGECFFLNELWPRVKLAMKHVFAIWDKDADGVLDGPQSTTWDRPLYGHNTFTSGLYLTALLATEKMAKIQGDDKMSQECRRRFEKGRKLLDAELWNGEYYIQIYDEAECQKYQYGIGCHSDQLIGQWWAHILGLGHILPEKHVKTALQSIYKYNWRRNFTGHKQQPRVYVCDNEKGLLICTWPKGHRVDPVTLYSDEVWTGIEYAVAGEMLFEGIVDKAFDIIKGARDRHDGRKRNPWNEVEAGDHYIRPMSSWILLEAVTGYRYDAAKKFLGLAPRLDTDNFRAFFIVNCGWGSFTQGRSHGRQVEIIHVAYGKLELEILAFQFTGGPKKQLQNITISINDQPIAATWKEDKGEVRIVLKQPIVISAKQTLQVIMTETMSM